MKRLHVYLLLVILAAQPTNGFAQSLRTVAYTGMPIDSMTTYAQFYWPTLNNHGHVAFSAEVLREGSPGLSGVFTASESAPPSLLALDGEVVPGIPNATFLALWDSRPFLNDNGQVLMHVFMYGTSGTYDGSAIWLAEPNGELKLLARGGDIAPGTNGAEFGSVGGTGESLGARFNNSGHVILNDILPNQPGITSDNSWGIWLLDDDSPSQLIALERNSAAGFPESTLYGNFLGSGLLNESGQIAFRGGHESFFPTASPGTGIWKGTPGNIELLVSTGDTAPGILQQPEYTSLGGITLNNHGDMVFTAVVDDAVLGVEAYNNAGIWGSRNGDSIELLYRELEQPPGLPAGAGFGAFSSTVINSAGDIAFIGLMQNAPGSGASPVDSNNDYGLWSEGGNGVLRLVAREGEQPNGIPSGIEFESFVSPALNSLGQLAFITYLRGEGVDNSNDQALFAEDTNGTLHLIARTGDTLDVDDGPGVDLRTIDLFAFYGNTGNEEGKRSGFNDNGQIAFLAYFTDGTSGVFVSSQVASLELVGDFDGNGNVDGSDFLAWQRGNSPNPLSLVDLDTWQNGYPTPQSISTSNSIAIPECTTLTLLSIVFGCLTVQRGYVIRPRSSWTSTFSS